VANPGTGEVDDYTRAVYTRPLRLKLEAADASKSFRAAAENSSGSRLRAVMTDDARQLSMGEVRDICERDGIGLHTLRRMAWLSAPSEYSPTRRALCYYTTQVSQILCGQRRSTQLATYVHNRTPTKALGGRTPFAV